MPEVPSGDDPDDSRTDSVPAGAPGRAELDPSGRFADDEVELVEVVAPDDEETDDRLVGSFRSRTGARERALGLLYEAQSKGLTGVEVMADLPVAPDAYAVEVVRGVTEHVDELDWYIAQTSHNWSIERMPRLDLAVLRMAVFELAHRPDVPSAVIINEAVELAKQFSTDDSGRFVNGVLSRLAAEIRS